MYIYILYYIIFYYMYIYIRATQPKTSAKELWLLTGASGEEEDGSGEAPKVYLQSALLFKNRNGHSWAVVKASLDFNTALGDSGGSGELHRHQRRPRSLRASDPPVAKSWGRVDAYEWPTRFDFEAAANYHTSKPTLPE